jgi:hypothetical protein
MRGGRNKFGPMYKRDRARKLQLMRQRQLAIQQARQQGLAIVSDSLPLSYSNGSPYGSQGITIKQEIQIPQVLHNIFGIRMSSKTRLSYGI